VADILITRAHALGLVEARAAAERMEGHLGQKFGLTGSWKGDTLHFKRPGVSGSLAITEKKLHLEIALGFMLKAMKPSIEMAVLHELDALFGGPHQA
jgi:putative polyhydroxyalkanoate system protein